MYVAVGRKVLTPLELVLSVSGAKQTNMGFFLKQACNFDQNSSKKTSCHEV
jgi:hypothetical protein